LDRLDEAYNHAWNAYSIPDVGFDTECVQLLAGESLSQLWTCVTTGPGVSQENIQLLRDEIEASRGIVPYIQYEPIQLATTPETPVLWPRGLMMFFSGAIGLIVGVLLILFKPSYLPRENLQKSDPSSN
jgi:hypothetical protein